GAKNAGLFAAQILGVTDEKVEQALVKNRETMKENVDEMRVTLPTNKVILPPETIGIIGGGQLGRMMAIEAKYMGYHVAVLDPTPNCPTAQVADKHFVAAYDDLEAIKELTEYSDVITYEFENVDLEAATYIEKA